MLKREEVEKVVGPRAPQSVKDVVEHPPFRVTTSTALETLASYLRKFPIDVVPVFKSVFSEEVAGVVYPHTALLIKSKKLDAKVGDFLNPPVVVKESWRIENVAEILIAESKWGALVVDEEGKYAGVVTLRGLLSALLLREPKARSVAAVYTSVDESKSRAGFVKAIERVSKIFKKLVGGEVDGYIVLNREGGAAGVLTVWDFLKSRRWFKGAGEPRPLFGTRVARGESKHVGAARVWRIMFRGVAVATPETPIEEVARYMASTGQYVVPVVDKDQRVVGAVTAWDVLHAYIYGPKEGREDVEVKRAVEVAVEKPALEAAIRVRPSKHVTGLRAKDVMLTDIPSVNIRDSLSRIRRVFLKSRSGIVAVVDDEGKIVGFITRRDFVTYIAEKSLGYWRRQKGKMLVLKEQVMPGETAKVLVEEGTAGDVMKTDFPTASPDTTVEEVAYKMLAAGREYVVVVGGDNAPVGVVTKDELVKAYKERGRRAKVGELMTPPEVATVNLFNSLSSTIRKINAYELDGVVVTEGNEVKGIVTVDDLSLRPIEESLRGERLIFFTKAGVLKKVTSGLSRIRYAKAGTLTASDVMKLVELKTGPEAEVVEVVDKLLEHGIVPVFDDQGRLVGVLNKMDVVKELARVYITYAAPEKIPEVEEAKQLAR
ncbi:CBS domain-containing protein [Pyrobaculum neutrophilum]|uniref:Signal transduction protein with CBS domains n=1 Tax=Pyrobaculum neutrophilum (strain DSM 2338 / JCM 9278 / NBRC 100436 / V24Sta) TaxID=444157 RepID=B1Y9Z1_PYRNV|nr:CBS domain-containing protein [Pyrobaculum neutrophilum]ACB40541.1 putative signal transduction protein with CBS domains [Pyrobaculum neutrophilum V24Sta]